MLLKPALATQAASVLPNVSSSLLLPLLLILFSSASLSGFHLACTSSLGAISLRFHPVSFHAAVCCQAKGSYIVPGATLLGAVLIWYTKKKVVTASTCYTSRFRFTAVSSSLLLPLLLILFSSASLSGFHLACTSSLGAISLRFHPVSFHAAVCCQAKGSYIVPGATLLGAVLIWYTINRLLQPALATQAASDLRLCLRLFFFFFLFFLFSSLLLLSQASTSRVHLPLEQSLSASTLSPSMQRSAVKPKAHT